MELNLLILVGELWLLAILVVVLHRVSPRYGLTPFLIFVGMLLTMTRVMSLIQPFVRASSVFVFGFTGNVLVPVIVFSVLLVYVVQGTFPARIVIASGLLLDILFTLIIIGLRVHLSLPGGVSFAGITPDHAILTPRIGTAIASTTAFIIDLFVVAIVYQGLQNYAARLPGWIRTGFSLILALAVNSIMFSTLDFLLGASDFQRLIMRLPGRILGQTISALLLMPIAAFYLNQVVPRLPSYAGRQKRRTLDLLFGSQGRVERQLMTTLSQLEEQEQAFQNLADEVSHTTHDLKNPLTVLRIHLYKLARVSDPLEQLQIIQSSEALVRHLNELVENLLILSRLSEPKTIELRPLNLNDLLTEVYRNFKPVTDGKQQDFALNNTSESLMVRGDYVELTRAFCNLVLNASQYTPEGGAIKLETSIDGGSVVISVKDTGIGVAPENLEHIWDRFYRVDYEERQESGNAGLGLAIVRKIVERHSGEIDVTSTLGEGTTFTVHLERLQE